MSRNSKKLKNAFNVRLNQTLGEKIKDRIAGGKDAAVEKIPAKKPKGRAAQRIKVREQPVTKCTCNKRNRTLNRRGECNRCGKKP